MKKLKLDLEGLSLEELRTYQEVLVSTMSKLKHGLFNAEAALGLQASLTILSDLHLQVSSFATECKDKMSDMNFTTELVSEDE